MLFLCKNLEQLLKEIALKLHRGDTSKMGDILRKRHDLMAKLAQAQPNREDAIDVANSLKTLIGLEKLITALAEKKQNEIMEDLKKIRNQKTANDAYLHQSLKGVRP